MVRVVEKSQMEFGQVNIANIEFDAKSRDDIPRILKGLQYIYTNRSIRDEIFALLEQHVAAGVDKKDGRPGMELWKILVLGVLRLDLNCDYDRLHQLANEHRTIRQLLGHADFFDKHYYHLQTIKDNVNLLTPDLLDRINQVIVRSGHLLLKKKENILLHGRCDSFVVETDVHYPTDINLLFDAMRKIITLIGRLCHRRGLSDWRQSTYNIRHVKKLMRIAQQKKRARGRTEVQKEKCKQQMILAYQEYIDVCLRYLLKATATLDKLHSLSLDHQGLLIETAIQGFFKHADRQMDQIRRRVILGETIPHAEKVFSIFEPHTEWVVKGKAGVPQELGLKVCVVEDQYQFILHHHVMEKEVDNDIAVLMVQETKKRFSNFNSCSFDKGFHSPENQEHLKKELEIVSLPRKGRLSQEARVIESSEEYRKARRKHSAVESAINALEVHGLDRCLDFGINGFKCYVALSIVARNIDHIGAILTLHERKCEERKRKRCANQSKKLKQAA